MRTEVFENRGRESELVAMTQPWHSMHYKELHALAPFFPLSGLHEASQHLAALCPLLLAPLAEQILSRGAETGYSDFQRVPSFSGKVVRPNTIRRTI